MRPCGQCKGEKVVQKKKVLDVVVEKGMQHIQKITFPGEADEAPDTVTGYIIFVLSSSAGRVTTPSACRLRPSLRPCAASNMFSPIWTASNCSSGTSGSSIYASNGFNRCFSLMVLINDSADSFKAINDEGMSMYQRPFMKGKLYPLHSGLPRLAEPGPVQGPRDCL
ncbi:hypothetical protein ACQ4PT_011971 [Festuca glaucescens]